jgi:hypothetical protein
VKIFCRTDIKMSCLRFALQDIDVKEFHPF